MIIFRQRSLWDKIKRLVPSIRRKQDAQTYEAIRHLMNNPETPCIINDHYIPNGYGIEGFEWLGL